MNIFNVVLFIGHISLKLWLKSDAKLSIKDKRVMTKRRQTWDNSDKQIHLSLIIIIIIIIVIYLSHI